MPNKKQQLKFLLAFVTLLLPLIVYAKSGKKGTRSDISAGEQGKAVLWRDPDNIKARNLFYGPGGEAHAPRTAFTFEKEDLEGTSPKFVVRDDNSVKWKAKMGFEARPETVASRFVWAVGYSTNEDYFLGELSVKGMPERLHRGQKFIEPQGISHNVRLKRYLEGEKKVGAWRWSDNPFASTRELNGLRVVMALINNWDLKDINNAIYYEKHPESSDEPANVYLVSDLGATFGTTGVTLKRAATDGILHHYSASKFLRRVTPSYVDFAVPSLPVVLDIFDPRDFFMRVHMRWIGRKIPRADVHWIGQLLAQLSPQQIRDAFRAGGYSPGDVEGFAKVMEKRIAELRDL
jgi:hypothetical protein